MGETLCTLSTAIGRTVILDSERAWLHRTRRIFPLLQLFDHGLELLQLILHALLRINGIPSMPVLTSIAQRVQREQIVHIAPYALDPDGELRVDDVVTMLETAKQLAVVWV